MDLGLVQLRTLAPLRPDQRPANYDENAKCEFHSGAPGHNIENCKAFKHTVQDLVDSKAINSAPSPNVNANPMPAHGQRGVNAISEEGRVGLSSVNQLKAPLAEVKRQLLKNGVYPGCDEQCAKCVGAPDGCELLRKTVQSLMDDGSILIEKVDMGKEEVSTIIIYFDPIDLSTLAEAAPVTITVPGPIPYDKEDAVPWHYGGEVYCNGERVEDQTADETTVSKVDNAGPSGFTRSGRLFAPDALRREEGEKEKKEKAEALARAKGKAVVSDSTPVVTPAPLGSEEKLDDDAEEFLRIIKKSEYKLVDHLQQTPSKISILSLLLSSEGHREALLKILRKAYVPQEITINQLETVVSNVHASHGLGFTDMDLTVDGRNHNRALHIAMECKGAVLSHVLVDTGSSLNVLPKKALAKLNCDGLILTPTDLIVRAFDGSKRAVLGEVELPVKIGPEVFKSTFYVMDIQPAYSCLLGRPWIHAAGAVTSTLHQKLKYIWEGQETPSQAFETVKVENALFAKEEEKPSIASYKQAAEVVKNGEAPGWGRMMDISAKKDRFGVGYQPGRGSGQGRGRRTSVTFTSAGMLDPDHICMMSEEADSDCDIDRWIKPCAPGMGIQNWKAEKIIRVTLLEECDSSPDLIDNNPVTPSYDFDNPIYHAEEEGEEDCELPGELARLLKQEEKVIQPHEEQIEVVNLGTDEVKKEVKIGVALEESVKSRMVALLKEYVDIFAWSYQDMPGLDTDIVVHKLPLRADCPPVKQKLRRTRPDMAMKIKEEVQKQWDAGFLAVTNYPPWVANIVPVPKKDGKVRMCVDYRDLNRASPKDDFPLPHIDVLVDNTAQFSVFSFMDGFSGYNQIKMSPDDMEKTTFITPWGTFFTR
ncbi:hypothetical protein KIW84_074644 [Lathyrus oleraceus]|uniref:Reverse transcriptase domain-containing protein n=1 Tax=Pisum sativum TaxID=3888 RepID=A0A9D4VSY0_PEA|nr:hypothetical protein KIW84_074644 [Pisum sativum]